MKFSLIKLTTLLFIGVTVVVAGCGNVENETPSGPVFSGKRDPAVVDVNTAAELGVASTEGAQQAIYTATTNMGELANALYEGLKLYSESSQNSSDNLPAGISIPANIISRGFCGGVIATTDLIVPGFTDAKLEFQDVCYDSRASGRIIVDGRVEVSRSATSFTMKFVQFTVNVNGATQVINYIVSCEGEVCTAFSDFVGTDGKTYQIANFVVSGDEVLGYTVSAMLFHPELGAVTVKTTAAVTLNCGKRYPGAGTLEFSSANGSMGSITFRSDCTGYDGTYDDGVNTGTFSGNWS